MSKQALKRLTSSILFSSFFLAPLKVSAQIKNWDDLNGDGVPYSVSKDPADTCLVNDVPTLKCLEVVTGNLMFMTNALILLVLFIMFVIGSYKYLLSLGDPSKVEDAKKTFTWAVIGLVVYVSSYLILFTIDQLFLGGNGDIFRFRIGE